MCLHLSVCVHFACVCAHLPAGACVLGWRCREARLGLSCHDHSPSESCRAPLHFQSHSPLQLDSADTGNPQNILPESRALGSPQACRAPVATQGLPLLQDSEDSSDGVTGAGGQVPDCCKPKAHETCSSVPDLRTGGQRGQVWGALLSHTPASQFHLLGLGPQRGVLGLVSRTERRHLGGQPEGLGERRWNQLGHKFKTVRAQTLVELTHHRRGGRSIK